MSYLLSSRFLRKKSPPPPPDPTTKKKVKTMTSTQQTTERILQESITHVVSNEECCLRFGATNTSPTLVKLQQLPNRVQQRESHDQIAKQILCKVLMVVLSNHCAGFLKTAGSDGRLLPLDEAMSKWIKRLGFGLRGGLLCGDCPGHFH